MDINASRSDFGFAERIAEEQLPAACLIRETSAFWSARRKKHSLSSRQDIDPIDLGPRILPWVFLTDVVDADAGMDFRFRLAGTSNVRLVGIEPRGRLASEIFAADARGFMLAGYRKTVVEGAATFWYGRTLASLSTSRRVFHGLFPLAADGKHVDMLLGITEPEVMWPSEAKALPLSDKRRLAVANVVRAPR